MKKKLKSRLRSKRGESLGEVLIAILIASLALVMLASMIQSTNDIVRTSKNAMKKYLTANNALVEKLDATPEGHSGGESGDDSGDVSEEGEGAGAVIAEGSLEFTMMHSDDSMLKAALLTDESESSKIAVVYYINQTVSNVPVVSYKKGS